MGAEGEIWNRQFSHAEEFVQNIRGSLLTKDGLCKFLHRADALEPAEALLLRLLPAAWLNTYAHPGKGKKAGSSRLRVRDSLLSFLLYSDK